VILIFLTGCSVPDMLSVDAGSALAAGDAHPAAAITPLPETTTPGAAAVILDISEIGMVSQPGREPTAMQIGMQLPAGENVRLWSLGTVKLQLADGALVCMDQDTILNLEAVIGVSPEGDRLVLEKGGLRVQAKASEVVVKAAYGQAYQASALAGDMGVTYDARQAAFSMACLSGECRIGSPNPVAIQPGFQAGYSQGVLDQPAPADLAHWQGLCASQATPPPDVQPASPTPPPPIPSPPALPTAPPPDVQPVVPTPTSAPPVTLATSPPATWTAAAPPTASPTAAAALVAPAVAVITPVPTIQSISATGGLWPTQVPYYGYLYNWSYTSYGYYNNYTNTQARSYWGPQPGTGTASPGPGTLPSVVPAPVVGPMPGPVPPVPPPAP
jgi:hypothetical protein